VVLIFIVMNVVYHVSDKSYCKNKYDEKESLVGMTVIFEDIHILSREGISPVLVEQLYYCESVTRALLVNEGVLHEGEVDSWIGNASYPLSQYVPEAVVPKLSLHNLLLKNSDMQTLLSNFSPTFSFVFF